MHDEEEIDVEAIDDQVVPPFKFSWRTVIGDMLNNVGGTIEQLAAFPHDIALRIEGDRKWRERNRAFIEEGAKDIEKLIAEVEHAPTRRP